MDNFKVALAVIKKRILDVVKEGRPLIIGGDWNARVGKGWNDRGETTYNARGIDGVFQKAGPLGASVGRGNTSVYMESWKMKKHCGLCGSMKMDEQGSWQQSYSEEDHKRWREYKHRSKRFFKGEELKAMVRKTWKGAAMVEDLWSKWKKGFWDIQ
ncbi:hypothetical protein QOT17_025449 [Balamuthia mandrillaris]